jgi:hypothetical protein
MPIYNYKRTQIKKMKKISILLASAAIVFMSCGKVNVTSNTIASAMFINAAPGNTTHNIIVDDLSQTGTALVYRAVSQYLNLAIGARKINMRSNNLALPVDYVSLSSESFADNTASTYVTYDVLATPTSSLRSVRFSDDLTTPKTGFIKVRYLPLAIGVPTSDVTFLRTSNVLPIPPDSVTISNLSYIGNSPTSSQIADLSKFIEIPAGSYTIKQKIAGTQTVLLQVSTTPAIAGVVRGIYTYFGTGNVPSVPLAINVARNYP